MTTVQETDPTPQVDWRAVLASGATALARWAGGSAAAGSGSHVEPVPADLAAVVRRVAHDHGVGVGAVVLAAHARVLAALTGEAETLTALAAGPGHEPRPCRVDTGVDTGSALVAAAHAALVRAAAAPDPEATDRALADLRSDPAAGLWPPTVLNTTGTEDPGPDPVDDAATVLRVVWTGTVLRVDHRTDVLDEGAAARIAGYHLTALRQLTADPAAAPSRGCLLGPEELAFQVDGLAGPARELPDRRPHDLVRDRAATHPDDVAVVRGEEAWTYRDLDERSDAIARALLARGLGAEDVVAVVAERTLGWASCVLGILKSGGAYLPLEPHFPADRIATVLTRAGARFVLTEPGAATTLDEALAGLGTAAPTRLLVADAWAEDHAGVDPRVEVGPERLAYLYFTSGSTGEPKGAMCEQAGMLNHLLAKIEDMGIDEHSVVAQTAPQCFDISLWQLVAGWLVGATTVLVEQEVVLDVPRFVDLLARRRVSVAQLVPSYLDVVVSYLEQTPVALPDLRRVAVTGEAVKKELVVRWFAVRPDVPLVNAYGLTETSDDTNHEILFAVPDHERIPLGPAVRNVRVYVVDPELAPVPLGAPGEIVFSGVCVGRGYVNDPERTRAAFVPDPLRPGERLYRSGDHGRWLPDGKLDFLGRRDHQVKISGFRIEIGEIENTMLRGPGVRDAAVVVSERPGRGKQLVGFYGAPAPIADDELRGLLAASLPHYMVPPVLHHRDVLPVTANGKIDRKTLTALALELDEPTGPAGSGGGAPLTSTERRLAGVWAPLLGVDEDALTPDTHFFERGGSSLLAVKMAVRLKKAVTLQEIAAHPVLADLAALLDERAAASDPDPTAAP
ncbi:non-ribosomal peptide synthetase [Actinomycetospora termitidis]|uniref:Non-ribosomal peptide synthetase n=1 Tax=Actinomycetospora termitidis TaxID=3053470 RepID=A0ABT7MCF9_9PSEU|nr:non-ribosomal peptide synthetase [Actinomycetospora sp. Odt1-22]MDL5158360.1 non-ribosomal peptide synthetase [Actinomycetospora sp. Odt1-22]